MGIVTCHRKPVNVQAWQVPDYDVIEWDKIADWCNGTIVPGRELPYKTPAFILVGKGARVPAFVGDWIIKNSVNDIYPVPKLLFEQTYEIVPAIGDPLEKHRRYLRREMHRAESI
jgi:hypothetical protein